MLLTPEAQHTFLYSIDHQNYFKIRNKIIEIEHCVSYSLVILLTNYWRFRVMEIKIYGGSDRCILKTVFKSIYAIPLFTGLLLKRPFRTSPHCLG